MRTYDLVIVGTGMGGGTLAYALRDSGLKILLVERGDYLPSEPENWSPDAVFNQKRYKHPGKRLHAPLSDCRIHRNNGITTL